MAALSVNADPPRSAAQMVTKKNAPSALKGGVWLSFFRTGNDSMAEIISKRGLRRVHYLGNGGLIEAALPSSEQNLQPLTFNFQLG